MDDAPSSPASCVASSVTSGASISFAYTSRRRTACTPHVVIAASAAGIVGAAGVAEQSSPASSAHHPPRSPGRVRCADPCMQLVGDAIAPSWWPSAPSSRSGESGSVSAPAPIAPCCRLVFATLRDFVGFVLRRHFPGVRGTVVGIGAGHFPGLRRLIWAETPPLLRLFTLRATKPKLRTWSWDVVASVQRGAFGHSHQVGSNIVAVRICGSSHRLAAVAPMAIPADDATYR